MSPAAAAKATSHRRKLRARATQPVPRRLSGPREGLLRPTRPAQRSGGSLPIPARLVRFARSMPDRAIVDRLVRGRAWIPVLGVMLAGIVAMQVELLKLNSSIGRAIDRTTALQSRNEQLRASVATLADDQRIERAAAGMGMVMPTPESVVFLTPRATDVEDAAMHMRSPDAAVFAALQPTPSTNLAATAIAAGGGTPPAQGASSATSGASSSSTSLSSGNTPPASASSASASPSAGSSSAPASSGTVGSGGSPAAASTASVTGGTSPVPSAQSTSAGG